MRHLCYLATLLLVAACAFAQSPSWAINKERFETAQVNSGDDTPIFRVNVDLATFDVAVLDKKGGHPIGSLSSTDFVVYEDGVPQPITSFSQDQLPLSIVMLFDLTDSVRPVLKSLANGALAALEHLKPQDEVAVMVYAASATLLQDFTTDRALAAAAITRASQMKSDEAAFFNEGLFQAAQQAAKATIPGTRRVIIWLTDNVPNFPSYDVRVRYGRSLAHSTLHTEKQALDALFRIGPMVCALVQHSEVSEQAIMDRNAHWADYMLQRGQYPPGDVFRYAEQTGGEVTESNARHMAAKLADMIDSIRARYTLGFRPTSRVREGKYRELRVRLSPDAERRLGRVQIVAKKMLIR